MKIKDLFLLLVLLGLIGCVGTTDNNVPDNQPTLERAALAAQSIVKLKFLGECNFLPDIRGEETSIPGKFKVLQKFTSTRYGTDEEEFVYKIYIQHKGGDATDEFNWDYTELIIENTATGKQEIYKPNDIGAEVDVEPRQVRFADVMFTVVEETPNYIRLSSPKRLSHSKLKAVAKEMKHLFSSVYFHEVNKTERGAEYAAIQGNNLFDYDNSESISKID